MNAMHDRWYFKCVRHDKGCSGRAVCDYTIGHDLSNFVITSEHSDFCEPNNENQSVIGTARAALFEQVLREGQVRMY